jgi:putative inorganic carbon (HCO3(-)) transporter
MRRDHPQADYEPVTRSRPRSAPEEVDAREKLWPTAKKRAAVSDSESKQDDHKPPSTFKKKGSPTLLKPGHALTYAGIFLFTLVLYARPAEFYPSPLTNSLAFIVAMATLVTYVPFQLKIDGTLTARPREVNLILLFCLTALLAVPLAISPALAWKTFNDTFIRCIVMFIVMVNVLRTEKRLKGMLLLTIVVSIWLSVGAINDYRLGLTTVEGYRVGGRGTGIFGNSNDMALYIATVVPIAIALFFGTRRISAKIFYGASVALMIGATVLTYSRGAFLGLLVVFIYMGLKLGRSNKFGVMALIFVVCGGIMVLAPGNYGLRLMSIFIPSLDPVGSSDARKGELIRSIQVAIRHPLFGIGMGNYSEMMSYRGLVTHNAYTQVAAEMGMTALCLYVMFIIRPLRRLGRIARATFEGRRDSHYYYLSVGLQAALLAYIVTSFFASVAYQWYIYYLVAYAVCLRRLYEAETGEMIVIEKRRDKQLKAMQERRPALVKNEGRAATT